MRYLLAVLLATQSLSVRAQDYIVYHQVFNRVDEDIMSDRLQAAVPRLDSIDAAYEFVHARNCFKALQVCCKLDDSVRAARWLARCFRRGITREALRSHELTAKAFSYASAAPAIAAYDEYRAAYNKGINRQVAEQIQALLETDQRRTSRVNNGFVAFRYTVYGLQWLHNNRKQAQAIRKIAARYGFPGERLIGLDPYYDNPAVWNGAQSLRRGTLNDERAYVMLVHYYSYPGRNMDSLLLEAVKSGNLLPWQYGTLQDYQLQYGREHPPVHRYYYVWKPYQEGESEAAINERRNSVGLPAYAQQQQTDSITRSRRSRKSDYREIILQ